MQSEVAWVAKLVAVALDFREGSRSIVELVAEADPDTSDRAAFLSALTSYFRQHPDLVRAWSNYAGDKRTSWGPYFNLGEPSEVGIYSRGYDDVRRYEDPADACADFLWREVSQMRGNLARPVGDPGSDSMA